MKAELTAENRPACVSPKSVLRVDHRNTPTNEDEGRVQIFVVLFRVIAVKFFRLSAIYSEEVGPWVISPEWIEEFLEGGMEAGVGISANGLVIVVNE